MTFWASYPRMQTMAAAEGLEVRRLFGHSLARANRTRRMEAPYGGGERLWATSCRELGASAVVPGAAFSGRRPERELSDLGLHPA
jgi:pyruvate/2-oxoglutarate/acetoin dehydrogenase E1 component